MLFSDSLKLTRAIEVSLQSLGKTHPFTMDVLELVAGRTINIDLIIIAISTPTSRAELSQLLQSQLVLSADITPILLISDCPPQSRDGKQAPKHLLFPFNAQSLVDTVTGLLSVEKRIHFPARQDVARL